MSSLLRILAPWPPFLLCALPAFGQAIEVVLDEGATAAGFGRIRQVAPVAVNDSGSWVAYVWGTRGTGLVVDGAPHLLIGDPLPGGGSVLGVFDPQIDDRGRVVAAVTTGVSPGHTAVLLDGTEILRTGDDAGGLGASWSSARIAGITDGGRVVLWGSTYIGTQPLRVSLGFLDVDAAGTVVGRGLIAHADRPLPHGLGQLVAIDEIAVSRSGSILWQGKRSSGSSATDAFLMRDGTLLLLEGSPSLWSGETWRVEPGQISISSDGAHWSIAGWLTGGSNDRRYGVVVDGDSRYGEGTALPGLAPYALSPPRVAFVDDAGSVLWLGDVSAPDERFRRGVAFDGDALFWSGTNEIRGQISDLDFVRASPQRRYALGAASRPGARALVRLDRLAPGLPCGAGSDPFEPNDTCRAAARLQSESPLATVTRGVDEDWYVLEVAGSEVVGVQALHSARRSEVDLEVYAGSCGALAPLASTSQAAPDEGLIVRNPVPTTNRLFVRVTVPQSSPSPCADYALAIARGLGATCTPQASPDDAFEPNDSYASSSPIGIGHHAGLFVSGYAPDYYRISVPPMTAVSLRATASSGTGLRLARILPGSSVLRTSVSAGMSVTVDLFNASSLARAEVVELYMHGGAVCTTYDLTVSLVGLPVGSVACDGVPNSTGAPATIQGNGINVTPFEQLQLSTAGLPPGTAGHYLASPSPPQITLNPGGSSGNLCLGHPIGRMISTLQRENGLGQVASDIDLSSLPTPTGTTSVVAGSTWTFQFWYRDTDPGPTSNFSAALSVPFY